jgi:hypothetical protein
MPERLPSERELEQTLRAIGSRLEYPPTRDLARAVRHRLQEDPAPRRLFPATLTPSRRRLATAAVAMMLVIAGTLGISSPIRTAVADWLGLEGIMIIRKDSPPKEKPPIGTALDLGEKSTLRDARARAGANGILLPELGEPDAVYVKPAYGNEITLVYRARPGLPPIGDTEIGLLLNELPGNNGMYLTKSLPPGTDLEEVEVNGERGYWISGKPHLLSPIGGKKRLAGNTLLWEQGDLTLRLESSLSRKEALEIAHSVR